MSNFLSNMSELYRLWLNASLYPRCVSVLLLLLPVIITVIGMIVITRQVRRGGKWTD